MQIFVRLPNKTACYQVDASDSLSSLKKRIEMEEGLPANEQVLQHKHKFLRNDEQSLTDSNIMDMDSLSLRFSIRGGVTVTIKNPGKPAFSLEVEPSDTIKVIKDKIFIRDGISLDYEDLKLAYRGKNLTNDICLSSLQCKGPLTLLATTPKVTNKPAPKDEEPIAVVTGPCKAGCGFYGYLTN